MEVPNQTESDSDSDSEASEKNKVPRGSIVEYIHVEYIPDRNGNWVTKRIEDPLDDPDDEFGGYSFVVMRDWDWERKSPVNSIEHRLIFPSGTHYTVYIEVKSELLKRELRVAMGEIEGFSWNELPLRVRP